MPLHRLVPDLRIAELLMEVQWPAEPESYNMEGPTLHVVSAQDLDERGKPVTSGRNSHPEARLAIEDQWKIKVVRFAPANDN